MDYFDYKIKIYIETFQKLEPNLALSIGIISPLGEHLSYFSKVFPDIGGYIYEVGSISKVYVSSFLAKLLQEKKINLEDTIDKYLDLPEGKVYPTLVSLMTHTSGYAPLLSFRFIWAYLLKNKNMKFNLYKGVKSNHLYKQINSIRLKKKKYKYHYTDMNAAILGEIISKVEKKPFNIAMNDFLKNHLNLPDSVLSAGISRNLESYYREKIRYHLSWETDDVYAAAGGVLSTISDSLLFLKKNLEHNPSYLTLTQKKYKRILFSGRPMAMGLGWHMYPDGNYMFHKGGTSCFRSSYLIDKKKKIGVAVLANVIGNREYNTTKLSMMLRRKVKELLLENTAKNKSNRKLREDSNWIGTENYQ
jgi:CubicO group peptidase (beta-lactamase class C family)